jgi:hypothetical protein
MKTSSLNIKKLLIPVMGLAFLATTAACEKTDRSFSLLDTGSTFQQAPNFVPRKIDILWVVDNSGSMANSQANLTASFQSFMNRFQALNYDFHMAVTSTDAWRAAYQTGANAAANAHVLKRARPGEINFTTNPLTYRTNSNQFILDRSTPNVANVFVTNGTQGISGSGDERAFASMKEFLNYDGNSDFRRADAILAVIFVSDEDDFSVNTSGYVAGAYYDEVNADPLVLPPSSDPKNLYNLYRDSRMDTVASYKTYLDTLVGAGNYSVNMIGILDNQCKANLNMNGAGKRLGRRMIELTDLTKGVKASLCGNFGDSLTLISDSIIQLSAVFTLNREPVVESIKVIVDGVTVPNDASNGWTYNSADWTVTFHGTSVPAQGSNIQILFTPARAAN